MREQLPQISYERGMNHNYMVLSECDFFGTSKDRNSDYRVRMLLENKIKGLLPVTYRQVNGESKYYYEINSLQSLDRMLEKRELKYREMRAVLLGCINLFEQLEEYLLSGEQIIIRAEFIYVNVESMEPYFVCYPEYKGDVRVSFMEFTDMLLTRLDHTDEQAVMLGYQVYRYTRNPNYVLDEIRGFMEYTEPDFIKKDLDEKASDDFHFEACEGNLYNNYTEKAAVKNITDTGFEKNAMDLGIEQEYRLEKNAAEGISREKGDIKELAGGIFCIFIALCAGAIIAGARVLKCFALSDKNELYMYGAIAMAVTAAALFFSCYVKSRKQQYTENALQTADYDKSDNYTRAVYEEHIKRDIAINTSPKISEVSVQGAGETVCLGNERIEERILRGRVNGREVNMSLERLPVTIGKLGGVSDFIINDAAVSKMHARFEEHEGRVCICDLNSTNGTIRNGELIAINTPVALEPGDKLRFGRSSFTYC